MKDSLLDQRLHFPPHRARRGAAILPASHHPGPQIPDLYQLFWGSCAKKRKRKREWTQAGSQPAKEINTLAGFSTCMSCRHTHAVLLIHPSLLSTLLLPTLRNVPSPLALRALSIIRPTGLSDELFGQYSQQCPRRGRAKSVKVHELRDSTQVKQMSRCFCGQYCTLRPPLIFKVSLRQLEAI